MKDLLGRDIMLGDTLAYSQAEYRSSRYPTPSLKTATVTGVSVFALQLTPTITGDADPETFVISNADLYLICDWAKGSDAAS